MTKYPFGVNLTLLPSMVPPDYGAYAQDGAASADFFAEVFGGWLGEGCELDCSVRYFMQLGLSFKGPTTAPTPK
jgi:hypothetical protein